MKRTRLIWILGCLLAMAYVATGLSRISFDVDILRLLPSRLHQVEGLSLFLKNFALPNELILTVEGGDAAAVRSSADAIAKTLNGRPDLVRSAVAEPPWENNPASLAEFLTYLLVNQPPGKTGEIRQRLSTRHAEETVRETLEELGSTLSPRDIALLGCDPYRLSSSVTLGGSGLFSGAEQGGFSSADGTFRVVYVESARHFADYKETAAWLKHIRELASGPAAVGGVTLGFTGEPAFVAEIATGMQRDMITSAFGTLSLITLIFWTCYGRFTPLCWLLVLLQLIFLLSLATAGFLLDQLTAIGAGFASVMIGLSVDYGYFIYQQSLRHTGGVRQLQWKCLQNILWTSGTTAAAFFALNLSSLPGLSQLGNMVGIGVCIGALVMLGVFAPLSLRFRKSAKEAIPSRLDTVFSAARFWLFGEWITLGLVVILLGGLLMKGFPKADFSPSSLRPKNSPSQQALDRLSARLRDDRGELNLVVTGASEEEVLSRLQAVQGRLESARRRGDLKSFLSPLPLWPAQKNQRENIALLGPIAADLPRLRKTVLVNGFNEDGFTLTESVFHQVTAWEKSPLPLWPGNETSRWILRRAARHAEGTFLALGLVEPVPGHESALADSFSSEGVYLVSWATLGKELERAMPREILLVSLGLMAGILVILAFGLRSFRALGLFVATTLLVLSCLAGAMSLLGMTWGVFNLAAVLLLLGTGTDYSILLLLSLRRSGGDFSPARRGLGPVIFLCCISAAAGFGSLAWAGNPGLAALGETCALGLLIDGMISLFALPRAWELLIPRPKGSTDITLGCDAARKASPSNPRCDVLP